MIRTAKKTDMEQLLQIWLNSNIDAHDFIPPKYWIDNYPLVADQLPQADIYLYEADGNIYGFVGVMDDYIAGIFVDKAHRSAGIGRQLLNHVKALYPTLSLGVYQKNQRAVRFYLREGFAINNEQLDQSTGEIEYTMFWQRNNTAPNI